MTKRSLSLTGAFLLTVPVYLLGLWFYVCSVAKGYPQTVELYHSYFPELLRGRYASSLLSLLFCGIGIGLNIGNLNDQSRKYKSLAIFVVSTGSLLFFINLWSVM